MVKRLIVILIVDVLFASFATGGKLAREVGVCSTKECLQAAENMKQAMNPNVDPCDNFFEFSCGAWNQHNPIPPSSSSWNQFNILREELSLKMKGILESETTESDPAPLTWSKQFYRSCMGQNATDQTELHYFIERDLKLDNAHSALSLKLGELRRKLGAGYLVSLDVELDEENASRYIIYLDQPSFGLSRPFLVNPVPHPLVASYKELIKKMWPLVYPNDAADEGGLMKLADDIVNFETKIAEKSTAPKDRGDRASLYKVMTFKQFKDLSSGASMIDWDVYMTEAFSATKLDLGPLNDLKVVVRDTEYFAKVGHVLKETEPTLIDKYVKWRVILKLANVVSDNLRNVLFEFVRKTSGTSTPAPRWKTCADKTNTYLGMAVSYRYVQESLTKEFRSQMEEMITGIQDSLFHVMDTVEWIKSPTTREAAKEKAHKMTKLIGYPEWLDNPSSLTSYYKSVHLSNPDNFFTNYLDLAGWTTLEGLKALKHVKDNSQWITDPTVVNAFYASSYNSISFPAGILQPPFYFTGKPIQALNYGGIGMVIGHEIIHGFDNSGRQSDGDGNLREWWDNETINEYKVRAECFADQYGHFQAEDANNLKLNGWQTLGENIADNGGIRQAFNAYQAYVTKYGPEPSLPGLDYTPEQLFYISFAQIWCGSYTPQGMENQILSGSHSPNQFRVKGTVANSAEFAKTFKCQKPDEAKSCHLW